MQLSIESQLRTFYAEHHIKNIYIGNWIDMFDDQGRKLPGIRGRAGAAGIGVDGHPIGLDLMEIMPGSGFPRHTHAGDHLLLVVSGQGIATVGETDHQLSVGDSILVPAEQEHCFTVPEAATEPWLIVSVGHPHKHLSALDRLKTTGKQR